VTERILPVFASAPLHLIAACLCVLAAVFVLLAARGRAAAWLAVAPLAAALWLGVIAAMPRNPLDGPAGAAEILRAAVWFALLLALYWRVGHGRVAGPVMRFGLAGTILSGIAMAMLTPGAGVSIVLPSLGSPALLARLGLAIATVLLAENLYRNADEAARWHVNLPCIVLGGLSILDLLLYADAVLSRRFSEALIDSRAVLTALAMPLLAVAAARGRRLRRPLAVSRQVAFHGATLMIGGAFLLGIGAVGELLRRLGTDETGAEWTRAVQISLLAAALMAAAVAVASQSARSRFRRQVVDHFFAVRYDYRREWLRCVDTLSADEGETEAPVRAIRAIADPVDAPRGALLLLDSPEGGGNARYRWAGSWNMPEPPVALPPDHPLITALRGGAWVAELANPPADLAEGFGKLWLAVPLLHHREGVMGVVLLGPPRAPFALDVETFDLLRTLGQEVAMFLAERRAALRLVDQRQLQDYARRFAFVAHDVKTVSSQLSLLLANADENISDPEFQRDMLMTVRASAERINTLIARLRQPEPDPAPPPGAAAGDQDAIDPMARLRAIAASSRHPVTVELQGPPVDLAAISPARFDTAVTHLLDNAIEASDQGVPVRLVLRHAARNGWLEIDIIDQGPGMTPEFVRDRLFRPLDTSKARGSGIGAFQAQEALREAGGELAVLTSPGLGTTMRLSVRAHEAPPAATEAA
jgi:putative PEP-CTERM system histidine kinase